jgi:hypothetical protein
MGALEHESALAILSLHIILVILDQVLSLEDSLRVWIPDKVVKIKDLGTLNGILFSDDDGLKLVWAEVQGLNLFHTELLLLCEHAVVSISGKLVNHKVLIHEVESILVLYVESKALVRLQLEDALMAIDVLITGIALHNGALPVPFDDVVDEVSFTHHHLNWLEGELFLLIFLILSIIIFFVRFLAHEISVGNLHDGGPSQLVWELSPNVGLEFLVLLRAHSTLNHGGDDCVVE